LPGVSCKIGDKEKGSVILNRGGGTVDSGTSIDRKLHPGGQKGNPGVRRKIIKLLK